MRANCLLIVAVAIAASAASAQTPPGDWTCSAGFYTDNDCDCGCGAPDPACPDTRLASCDYGWCTNSNTDVPSSANPSVCVANTCGDGVVGGDEVCDDGGLNGCAADCLTVEAGWLCGTRSSRRFSGCHQPVCGDGLIDNDETCDDDDGATPQSGDGCSATCTLEDGFVCPEPGEACVQLPSGWSCNTAFFGDGDCDCGCTGADVDCTGGCTTPGCADAACEFCWDGTTNTGCEGEGEGEPGEGEGEGEGSAGEGEGEGEGGRGDNIGGDEPATGCASARVQRGAPPALALVVGLALLLGRRRAT